MAPDSGSPPGTDREGEAVMGLVSGLIKFNLLKRLLSRFTGRRRTY
jgi:hypothetical protein